MMPSLLDQITAAAATIRTQLDVPPRRPKGPKLASLMQRRRRDLLALLATADALTHREICQALPHSSDKSWAHIVRTLIAAGHIQKRRVAPDATGTRVVFCLSPAGRELLEQLARTTSQPTSIPNTEH